MSDQFGSVTGIDVSHHQSVIDWQKVKEDPQNIQFVFIKASEGETFTDPQFSNNVKGAQAAGIQAGAYHYARLLRGKAEKEAQNFVEKLKQHQLDLLPVLDLEEINTDLTADEIADWALAFAEHVKKETGEQILLYTSPSYINRFNGFNNRLKNVPLWLAHWGVDEPQLPATGGWEEITCWQYTDKGSVSGITGNVDMDKAKSLEALKSKKRSDNPPPEEPPNPPQSPEDDKDWHVELIASGSGSVNISFQFKKGNSDKEPAPSPEPEPEPDPEPEPKHEMIDDYPFKNNNPGDVDPWGFYYRECVSFVAWRINNTLGIPFTNDMTGPNGKKGHWGDGRHWDENARQIGYKVTRTPKVGAVAQWNKGNLNHVAFVAEVSSDQKTVTVEEYNWDVRHGYGTRQVPVDRIDNFIHIKE
jgi:GH25 family lysozyme M1 (1,4-beta-N-acetylmuramidase)/surface antigen